MSIAIRQNDSKPWYTHRWPWLLMLGPTLVAIAGSYTCWIAFTRQDAMVVDDYYKQGNAINKDLRRDVAATKLGLSFNAVYDPKHERITGQLVSFGRPFEGKIVLLFSHPIQPEKDRKLEAQVDAKGNFETPMPFFDIGRWNITIESNNRDWRLTGVWKWPQQESIKLSADLPPVQ